MPTDDDDSAEPIDRVEAKLDELLAGQRRIVEMLERVDAGQSTVVTRVNAIYRRGTVPRKK